MRQQYDIHDFEDFFGIGEKDEDPKEAVLACVFRDDAGAQTFAHGSRAAMVVALAALAQHISDFTGLSVGEVVRQARSIAQLQKGKSVAR
ncbi:MAG: hypothetical protein IKS31_01450 [Clostridia bacterium]|nr:hypothetical protein [Clostridia bacterium]